MKSKTNEYKKIILPIIEQYLPNTKVILYGSRARGDDTAGSDIDIALDSGTRIEDRILSNIVYALEESSLPIKFDLVDFTAVSDALKKDILHDGVPWKS